MSEWKSYHVYYSDIDVAILECVHPFLERTGDRLERRFWERHFAGGPHLRVRLRGSAPEVTAVGNDLISEVKRFLVERPSKDSVTYSMERAEALMRKEGEVPHDKALHYRNNTVEEHPYEPPRQVFASEDALALAEDFRHDSMMLAAQVLGGERPTAEALLRIFFLHALVVCRGDLPGGLVSCKSHWEGFAASFSAPQVIERIGENERRNRGAALELMREVASRYESGTVDHDPVLCAWRDLMEEYRTRAYRDLYEGKHITIQPKSVEEARETREKMFAHLHSESSFVRTFWSDERFIASMQHEPSWLVPRVLTNLLYQFVATVGIGPIDRMAICYYAFRAAEEEFGCDLGDILKGNIEKTLAAHIGR